MARFRLEFLDDGSTVEVEADDFDDDGSEIMLYRYLLPGLTHPHRLTPT